jgi:hypothetical protein
MRRLQLPRYRKTQCLPDSSCIPREPTTYRISMDTVLFLETIVHSSGRHETLHFMRNDCVGSRIRCLLVGLQFWYRPAEGQSRNFPLLYSLSSLLLLSLASLQDSFPFFFSVPSCPLCSFAYIFSSHLISTRSHSTIDNGLSLLYSWTAKVCCSQVGCLSAVQAATQERQGDYQGAKKAEPQAPSPQPTGWTSPTAVRCSAVTVRRCSSTAVPWTALWRSAVPWTVLRWSVLRWSAVRCWSSPTALRWSSSTAIRCSTATVCRRSSTTAVRWSAAIIHCRSSPTTTQCFFKVGKQANGN